MSLDPEDFQRIQANLIELKNENYSLQDQCRKQKNALGEAQAKITVYEKELTSAQKSIAKSKKAQEVQQIIKDNESLQHKLRCQEEEFRLQNQTLLEELSKLVVTNEGLEAKIRHLNEDSEDEIAKGLREDIKILQSSTKQLESEKKALFDQNQVLQKELNNISTTNSESVQDTSIVKVDPQGVSFRKQSSLVDGETKRQLSQDETKKLKQDLQGPSENNDWKAQCLSLQDQIVQYQEKLSKNQDSFVQLRKEKDEMQQDFCLKLESLKDEKDKELFNFREQTQRLQVQLNQGHSGFKEFKEKKLKEVNELNAIIENLKVQEPENLSQMQSELENLKSQLNQQQQENETLVRDKANLVEEIQDWVKKSNENSQEKAGIKKEMEELQHQLIEITKTSEKRKKHLDEQAIHIQKKISDSDEIIDRLNKELALLKANMQEIKEEKEGLQETIEKLESTEIGLQEKIQSLEASEAELEMSINEVNAKKEKEIKNIKDTFEDDVRILKSEHEIVLRDLNMQLEIAYAQKNEFEESIEQLKQEIVDQAEDRKIGEKKTHGLIKDLKKQLLSEKQRNEKLSDKIKEHFEPPSTLSDASQLEADRTSNSSWSIYSGQIEVKGTEENSNNVSPLPDSHVVEVQSNSLPSNAQALTNANTDYSTLLEKISSLQEEKWSAEQKLQMLEHSATAMADDLVKKSNLIQFYCMEGKQDHHTPKKENLSASEKMTKLKKRVDLLVNPEQVEAQQKEELQRMQRMLEETLTKNMHLQQSMEDLSQEVVRLSKLVPAKN